MVVLLVDGPLAVAKMRVLRRRRMVVLTSFGVVVSMALRSAEGSTDDRQTDGDHPGGSYSSARDLYWRGALSPMKARFGSAAADGVPTRVRKRGP
jgi:hypothetical protein